MLTRLVYDTVSLVESHPGCGPLLATVADHPSAGDPVAVHNLPHARAQLPHVSLLVASSDLVHTLDQPTAHV